MSIDLDLVMREQLVERRLRVAAAISTAGADPQLTALLREVDAALERFESGTYGLCEVCQDTVEADRLIANPLERFCLDHLNANEPARLVSGDYIDIIPSGDGNIYFVLGDVSGKGVAASMLMAKLHAVFRSLIPLGLGVDQLTERASRLFGDSTLPGQYATLICGRTSKHGAVSICNAGHPPGLLSSRGNIEQISATGLPLGMFPNQKFSVGNVQLDSGDSLILYTDGVPETVNPLNQEYGTSRLTDITRTSWSFTPEKLVATCLSDVSSFRQGQPRFDDISIMGIRRE